MSNSQITASPSFIANAHRYGAFIALPIIFFWFGGMKYTAYEAEAINGLIANSPFISFLLSFFSTQGISNLIGTVEIVIGAMIAARFVAPRIAQYGGYAAAATFALTASFFLTTPGVFEPSVGGLGISVLPGQFLLKDIGLLALSLFVASDAAQAANRSGE